MRINDMEMYDYMLENFKLCSPGTVENSVRCYQSDYHEITAVNEDGSRTIYDDLYHTICYIPNRDTPNLDSREWKRAFSRKIERLMTNRRMTQRDLAELSGIAEATISSYAKGASMPSAKNIQLLARAFKISIDELYDF